MIIKRVLNNNTIISLDPNGAEIIVKGKGIAFGKKPGQKADKSKTEKVFTLDTTETIRQYQEIIMDISEDIIELTEEIIEVIKNGTEKTISDKIYITLTDHISNLLERMALGIHFDSTLLWNVQALYPEEYQLAVQAVAMIRQHFDLPVANVEANFIAIHIVNSEMDLEIQETVRITETINQILLVIEECMDTTVFLENSELDKARFVLHLRFLLQRIIQEGILQYDKSDHMMALLMKEYPHQSVCVSTIMQVISEKYQKEIEGERLFLMIHVIRLTTAKEISG
ncbi:PRD domain-containing protein [Enterococcus sp. AZ163]|uniref:PRD domain-containing protein n=1 Tax=Enterococcus sp. AZ163 TaxID=2774638 RepID=UPI003D298A49